MKVMFCHDGEEMGQKALKAAVEFFKPHKADMISFKKNTKQSSINLRNG